MAFIAKGGDGGHFDYTPTPAGTYQAVVYNVFDLGHQREEYKGQSKVRHKCSVGFELVGMKYDSGELAGQPMTKYKDYSTTIFEDKGLGGLIPILIGRPLTDDEVKNGFDLESLIGKNCTITIVHKVSQTGKTYARIANIGGLMAGVKAVEPTIPRTHVPKFIAETQAKAETPQAPAQPAGPVGISPEEQWAKDDMHNNIQKWINEKKLKLTDVTATLRANKVQTWAELDHAAALKVYNVCQKLAQPDITDGTGFKAEPVMPPKE